MLTVAVTPLKFRVAAANENRLGGAVPQATRITDLTALTLREREEALARLVEDARAPANGSAVATAARIRAYEQQYEMSSAQLIQRLSTGEVRETAEIADWLFWLRVQARRGQ